MTQESCPVNHTILELKEVIGSGRLKHPKTRRIAEELLELLEDIAWGRAGAEHPEAMRSLARELMHEGMGQASFDLGRNLIATLDEHDEVFASHVRTHNCASGDCVKLAPAPCQMACPAGIDIPTYLTLIGMGKDAEAIEIIRKDNPFPWVCGLVCTRPCEFMCVRARIDKPVSVKTLKAFAAERALSERQYKNPPKAPDQNRKVCVIGAGPGGMSAAYYLALRGYKVTVIEALPVAGGMIMVGIPRYRLPREVIDREVAMIGELGVDFFFNVRFGTDVTLEDLKADGFEAFFFAIGAHQSYKLNIPGEKDFPEDIDAIELLKNVALGNHQVPGKRVIVIGGGNVAIDAARTCLRLGCEEVTVAYRRTRSEMPADEEELEQAEEEGIRFSYLTVPVGISGKKGHVTGLRYLRAKMVAKEGSARKYPVPMTDREYLAEADVVVTAIGQQVDADAMASLSDLRWTRRKTIDVNTATMETSVEGVFAAGDAVTGPATVIEAIGGGKKAADAIDRYLSGIPQPQTPPVPVRRGRTACAALSGEAKMLLKRPDMPLLNIDRRRLTFQQAELGYSEEMVRNEARRCLRCDICRRCGKCVEICRDKMGIDALRLGYMDFDNPGPTDFRFTKDRCILCGACAANCPNQAIRIRDQDGERVLSLCGTILNRQALIHCESCGAAMGTAGYLDYVRKRVGQKIRPASDETARLCDVCARKASAKYHDERSPV